MIRGFLLKHETNWGARFRAFGGNEEVYRSHINLGEGVKLFHSSFALTAPESRGRLFDHVQVNMSNWGGEPYNVAEVYLKKHLTYVFRYRYQKIDYFASIPDFVNPLLGRGGVTDQHRYDSTRRFSQARVDLFPDAPRFQIHFSYARNSAYGPAFTTVNLGGDEFLVAQRLKNNVNDYGVGADVRIGRLKISVEQAFRFFKDDPEGLLPGEFSIGNDPAPIFGFQQLFLTDFSRSVHLRRTIPTARLAVTSHRMPRIGFTARLMYSKASVDQDLVQRFQGVVLNRETAIFASDGLALAWAHPTRPQTVADGSVRVALVRRLSLSATFRGMRFGIAGSRDLAERFSNVEDPEVPVTRQEFSFRHLSLSSFMNQWEGDLALTRNMSIRAGHRVEHRRVVVKALDRGFDSFSGPDFPSLFRQRSEEAAQTAHTLLAGLSYRRSRAFRVTLDYENGGALTEFLSVRPRDTQRGRLRLQFAPSERWLFTAAAAVSDELRPSRALAIDYVFFNQLRNRWGSVSVSWFPIERFTLDAEYTRGHVTASLHRIDLRAGGALLPPLMYVEESDVLHAGVATTPVRELRLALGHRMIRSRGSRPLVFHRPYARLQVPLRRNLAVTMEYDYSGYNERECSRSPSPGIVCREGIPGSLFGYRAHLLTTGMRLTF